VVRDRLARGIGFATDALQVHGLASRSGKPPDALRRHFGAV
jgi:hypothetical protein